MALLYSTLSDETDALSNLLLVTSFQIDELVAAVRQHAIGPHGHDVAREHILSELVRA